MKYSIVLFCTLVAGLSLAVPLAGLAADEEKKNPSQQVVEGQAEKPEAAIATVTGQERTLASVAAMPVYKPPKRGAPGGRVSGGSRGLRRDWR